MNRYLIILIFSLLHVSFASGKLFSNDYAELRTRLADIIAPYDAKVGIAAIVDGHDTICINNDDRYPMMSVYKFHQALAVASILEQKGISLDSLIYIKKEELVPDTYSPFRDTYPEGNAYFPISELLIYTLQLSDNNACDILFRHLLGVEETDAALRKMGIDHFAISATEEAMHSDTKKCYDNWSTPLSSAVLLDRFVAGKIVSGIYYQFIQETMLNCTTGAERLYAGLPKGNVRLGHKTGTSGCSDQGKYIGVNDIGFVYLPGDRRYTVAVYVKDSNQKLGDTEEIIAKVSAELYSVLSK